MVSLFGMKFSLGPVLILRAKVINLPKADSSHFSCNPNGYTESCLSLQQCRISSRAALHEQLLPGSPA